MDVGDYLRRLLADMEKLRPEEASGRAIEVEVPSFPLSADDVTPLGLITSELVINAFKYGLGKIRVGIQREPDGLILSVSDEGGGFPADFDPGRRRGLGMRLVAALAKRPSDAITVDRSVPFSRIVVRLGFGGSR